MALVYWDLFFNPGQAWADFKRSDWQFLKSIEMTATPADDYLRVSLDGETFHQAKSSLADVRILDDQQKEVPYAIIEEKETASEEQYTPRVFNKVKLPKAYSSLTLDLGQEIYTNKLILNTRSKDFKRRVEIEGSSDARQWYVLRDNAYIFDFSGDQKIQLTSVSYPESNYRFLRIKVWNASETALELEGATVFYVKRTTPPRVVRPCKPVSREEEPKLKATICVLDLSYRNIPSDFITIETPEEKFSRLVEIQGSNDLKNWQRHLQSEFYRFRTSRYDVEKKTFQFPEARHRYLKVIIYNYDDPPMRLDRLEVQGIEKDLIFQAEPGRHYSLYYGNEEALAPRYDMERVKKYLNLGAIARVRLARENLNREFVRRVPRKPWTETQPVLFWGILVLLVVSLGGYVITQMSKTKAQDS